MAQHRQLSSDERLSLLRAQLSGARSGTKADQRMRLSRAQNLFVGVSLHAAARRNEGLELTELEQVLLDAMGRALPEEDIAQFGRVYREETSTAGAELFPDSLTGRPLSQGYTREELVADLPRLGAEIAAQPNASLVRLDQLGETDPFDTEEFAEALATYGGGITVVVGPQETKRERPEGSPLAYAKLSLRNFTCVETSNEWAHEDEIYWTTSAASDDGSHREYLSPEFKNITKGTSRTFADNAIVFDGNVDDWVTCTVACWEADDSSGGWYNDLRQGLRDVSNYCFKTSGDLEANSGEYEGSSAWFSLLGLVAHLFDWLLGLITNDDDLVKERSLAFDRSALRTLSQRPSGYETLDFNGGGDGRHLLTIRAHYAESIYTPMARKHSYLAADGNWRSETFQADFITAPALAVYDSKLYCMRSIPNSGLEWGSYDGSEWSAFTKVAGGASSPSAPAMAVFQDKLYSAHRSATGELYWNYFHNGQWSGFTSFKNGGRTAAAPALAAFGTKLFCVVRGGGTNTDLYWASFDGQAWTSFAKIGNGAASASAPALMNWGDSLLCVFRGLDDVAVHIPYLKKSVGGSFHWSEIGGFPGGATAAAPAVAVHGSNRHAMMRGPGADLDLSLVTWPYDRVSTGLASSPAPALASFNGTLHCIHRGF